MTHYLIRTESSSLGYNCFVNLCDNEFIGCGTRFSNMVTCKDCLDILAIHDLVEIEL